MNSAAALLALRAIRSSSVPNNNKWALSGRTLATAKTSGSSSGGVNVEGKNLDPPKNIFKTVDTGALGPGASKQSDYKNPEYFSYHNMSYSEMDVVMAKYRVPQPSSKK